MARKSKGRSGGRGGNGSGPSSSSPASRPQQQEAAAGPSTSTSSPIPCPPGYLWDGKRFYKMPPNLSRVRITDGSSSGSSSGSESERPPRKEPKLSSTSPSAIARRQEKKNKKKTSRIEDVTLVALNGGEDSSDEQHATIGSAFSFTPARPPASHLARASPSCQVSFTAPRDASPTSSLVRGWKLHALQRHADSFKFFSRDVVNRHTIPFAGMPSYDEGEPQSDVRVDYFDTAGGLVWLQAEAKPNGHGPPFFDDDDEEDDCTRGATFLDSAGRTHNTERFVSETSREDFWDGDTSSPSHPQQSQGDDWAPYGDQFHLDDSHIGFTPYRHPSLDRFRRQYDTRLYGFASKSKLPRGLIGINHNLAANQEWPQYQMPKRELVLNARIDPELITDTTCYELLHPTEPAPEPSGRPSLDLSIAIKVAPGEDYIMQICEIHWAPSGKVIVYIPPPHGEKEHTAIAVSQGSGLVWTGWSDGHIELFNPSAYTANVLECYPHHQRLFNQAFAPGANAPHFDRVLESSETSKRGSVLALHTVGSNEALVVFSSGDMLLLKATSPRHVDVVRQYVGCPEKGSELLSGKISIHEASRLLVVAGRDKQVRIWHLDDAHPLNTPWHRERKRGAAPLDLLPEDKSQHERLMKRIKKSNSNDSNSESEGVTPRNNKEAFLDALALRPLTSGVNSKLMQKPLADLKLWLGCGMTFSPTSWLADRDGQWEFTRGFANGKPKLVGAGLFPGLVCCISSPRGPALLYFEPGRGEGVRIEGPEEGERGGGGEGERGEGTEEREGDGSEMMEGVEGQ